MGTEASRHVCLVYTGLRARSEEEARSVVEAVATRLRLGHTQAWELLRRRPAIVADYLAVNIAERTAESLEALGLRLLILPAAGPMAKRRRGTAHLREEELVETDLDFLEVPTGATPEFLPEGPELPPVLAEEAAEWLDEIPGGGLLHPEPEVASGKDKLDSIMRELLKTPDKPPDEVELAPGTLAAEDLSRFWPLILSMREKIGASERVAVLRQLLRMGDAARDVVVQEASLTAEPTVQLLSDPLLRPLALELLGRMGQTGMTTMARELVRKSQQHQPMESFIELVVQAGPPGVEALGRALQDETDRALELQRDAERLEYENQREAAKFPEGEAVSKTKGMLERERKIADLQKEMEGVHKVRLEIVRALSHVPSEAVVIALMNVLQEPFEKVKSVAMAALISLGPLAVPALVRELKPTYISTVEADILAEIGGAAAPHLVEAMKHTSWTLEQDVLFRIGRPSVEPLLGGLDDPDPAVRLKAISVLGRIGDHRSVPKLIQLLQDPSTPREHRPRILWGLGRMADIRSVQPIIAAMQVPELGADAIKALHRMGPLTVDAIRQLGTGMLQPFIEALGDYALRPIAEEFLAQLGTLAFEPVMAAVDRPELRTAAIEILGQIGDPRAVEPLLQFMRDRDTDIRRTAIESLGLLKDTRALEPLLENLKDPEVAANAASALGHLADARAVSALVQCLTDQQEELPKKAAEALGKIGSPEAIEPLLKAVGVEHSRWMALVALARLGEPAREAMRQKGAPMIEALIAHLKRARTLGHLGRIDGPAVRTAIVGFLVGFGPVALEYLLKDFKKDEGIAEAVGCIRSPDTYQFLMTALLSDDPELHKQAAIALGWFGQRSAIPALVRLLETEGRDIESLKIFAESVLRLDAGTAIPELLKLLTTSQRKETVEAIEKIVMAQPEVVIPQLMEALKEEGETMIQIVLLEKFGPRAVDPLLTALRETALPDYKRRILQALGRIGGDRIVSALFDHLHDRNETVVMATVQALGKICSKRALSPLMELRDQLEREEPVLERAILQIKQWGT